MWQLKQLAFGILLAATVLPACADAQFTKGPGGWQISDETRLLDNARVFSGILDSSNEIPNSVGKADHASIIVRCSAGQLEVYVTWPVFLGTRSIPPVKYKFGAGEIKSEYWSPSDGGTAIFVRDTQSFANALAAEVPLVVQVQPYRGGVIEAAFQTQGAAQIVATALSACRH